MGGFDAKPRRFETYLTLKESHSAYFRNRNEATRNVLHKLWWRNFREDIQQKISSPWAMRRCKLVFYEAAMELDPVSFQD